MLLSPLAGLDDSPTFKEEWRNAALDESIRGCPSSNDSRMDFLSSDFGWLGANGILLDRDTEMMDDLFISVTLCTVKVICSDGRFSANHQI